MKNNTDSFQYADLDFECTYTSEWQPKEDGVPTAGWLIDVESVEYIGANPSDHYEARFQLGHNYAKIEATAIAAALENEQGLQRDYDENSKFTD